jgi:hypothetical protein
MKILNRVEFIDRTTGRYVIAERVDEGTEYWEKEFGGVRWYPFEAKPDVEQRVRDLFAAQDGNAVSVAA